MKFQSITASHYINDVENVVEIEYKDSNGLTIKIPFDSIEQAEKFQKELSNAIEKWKCY